MPQKPLGHKLVKLFFVFFRDLHPVPELWRYVLGIPPAVPRPWPPVTVRVVGTSYLPDLQEALDALKVEPQHVASEINPFNHISTPAEDCPGMRVRAVRVQGEDIFATVPNQIGTLR